MPWRWIEPEKFVAHGEVTVYHVYKGGQPAFYWYTTNPTDDDMNSPLGGEESGQFDVRELPKSPRETPALSVNGLHRTRICHAIRHGFLPERRDNA